MATIRIFISHSSREAGLAHALVNLLRSALSLPADKIRCTSVDGHRLEGGAQTDQELRQEILTADVFLGVVSPISIESAYVLFEMGARWGTDKRLIPLLAPGADITHLRGPLAGLSALRCTSESDLHQLVAQVAATLQLSLESAAVYLDELRVVKETSASSAAGFSKPKASTTLTTDESRRFTLTGEHLAVLVVIAQTPTSKTLMSFSIKFQAIKVFSMI